MENTKLAIHTKAFNLARRFTVQNENDLLQEDMYGNNLDIGNDHHYCNELAQRATSSSSLPSECMKFDDIIMEMKKRDTDTTPPSKMLS